MMDMFQSIANFGILIVIAAMYLYQTPKTMEKVTKVIESNSSVIKDSQTYHERMERYLESMKTDIENLKSNQNHEEFKEILARLEFKIDQLGK